MAKLQIGDVVRYDRIWSRDCKPPLWAVVHRVDSQGPWFRRLVDNERVKLNYTEWHASDSVGDEQYKDYAVIRSRPDPSEWPEEVCVAIAKLQLGVE
jgi:hypothetical protein